MGGTEINYVNEAFESNWISPVGPNITAFEDELAEYNGVSYCAALSSGTAAIHLALIILGINRGDEVICSTFTFSGSCNPIAYLGATPVFVDSERETWNMDPELLELAIKDRIAKKGRCPRAVILVHLYGMPAKLEEILAITRKYEIPLIEDAAEAIGSTYRARSWEVLASWGSIHSTAIRSSQRRGAARWFPLMSRGYKKPGSWPRRPVSLHPITSMNRSATIIA